MLGAFLIFPQFFVNILKILFSYEISSFCNM